MFPQLGDPGCLLMQKLLKAFPINFVIAIFVFGGSLYCNQAVEDLLKRCLIRVTVWLAEFFGVRLEPFKKILF
jgi:hypothetical protein